MTPLLSHHRNQRVVGKEVAVKFLVLGTFIVWLLVSLVALFRNKGD